MTDLSPVPVRRDYVDGRFGQIHFRVAVPEFPSAHPPLICFHMSPNSGRIYEVFLGHIGSDRTAVAPDTPGFGQSDPTPQPPTISDYAAAMGDLIDSLGFDEVDVMGYHTGSETCVELALQRPAQVRRLVLTSVPIFLEEELQEFRDHYGPTKLTEDGSHLVEKWKGHLFWAGPGWSKEHVAVHFPDSLLRPDISHWGHYAAFSYAMADSISKITQPILALNPHDDLHKHTQRAAALIQNGHIEDLPGWGHGYLEVRTEEACDLIRGFLNSEV